MRFATNFSTAGERCTMRAIEQYNKPWLDVPIMEVAGLYTPSGVTPAEARQWLIDNDVRILNIAGNADAGIEQVVASFIIEMLS